MSSDLDKLKAADRKFKEVGERMSRLKSKTASTILYVILVVTILGVLGYLIAMNSELNAERERRAANFKNFKRDVLKRGVGIPAPRLESALVAVRREPKVLSARWINRAGNYSLEVGVHDDGTNRKGYAEYLCVVLREQGIRGLSVKIVGADSTGQKKHRMLGWAPCPR